MSYRVPGERDPDEPLPDPARPWLLQTWLSRRVCPRCGDSLFAARREGHRLDACGVCGGGWLANEAAARMLAEASMVPVELSRIAEARRTPDLPRGASARCPDCGDDLRARVVHGMTVDVCDAHGTWYDAGELAAVATATLREHAARVARAAANDPELRALDRKLRIGGEIRAILVEMSRRYGGDE